MATRYRLFAHSRQTNQTQQSMDLINNTFLSDLAYSQQMANSYAQRLNQQFHLGVNDWQGSIEPYEHIENPQPFNFPARPS